MSNLPLAIVSSLAGIQTERHNVVAGEKKESTTTDQLRSKKQKTKQSKPENRTIGYANSPSCNFSFNTMSGQSKNKIRLSGALKGLEKLNHSHMSELSLSQHLYKTTPAKKPSGLNISASLIERIRKRHLEQNSQAISPKVQEAKAEEVNGEKRKYLNIALSNAKNVNMFEINNYYSAPPADDPALSIASQSVGSKRVESRVLELAKQKALLKQDNKPAHPKSARSRENNQMQTLQNKLSSISALWKSKKH